MNKKTLITLLVTAFVLIFSQAQAHEPLYGFGPHVLFKGGFAPHFTFHYGHDIETEYALGYGITKDWTVKGEVPFHIEDGNYEWGGVILKQKYRVYSYFEPGLTRQISGITSLHIPSEPGKPVVANIGAAGGQEALHWYWFFGAVYGVKSGTIPGDDGHGHNQNSNTLSVTPGNHLKYNATLGYRPMKTSYYKPDIVFFLEGVGKFQQKSVRKGDVISQTGGHAWSVAPTFMLTYRNVALRGGVEFGLADARYIEKPETNFKLILEWHL